jgi:hypothetical protein
MGDEPFIFTIKSFITKDSDDKIEKFIEKLREFFDYEDCNRIKKIALSSPQYPIKFSVFESAGNGGTRRTTVKVDPLFSFQSKDYVSYTLDEFLELGIEGIKENIKVKEAAEKYNL